jgi:hypothetical protein
MHEIERPQPMKGPRMQTSTSSPTPTSSQVTTDRRQHARFVVDPMYSAVSVAPAPSKRKASAPSVEGHVYDLSLIHI